MLFRSFEKAIFDSNWKSDTELVLLIMDIICCPFLNNKINNSDKKILLSDLDNLHNSIILPIINLEDYLKNINSILLKIYQNDSITIIDRRLMQKIAHTYNEYKNELNKSYGFSVYKHEENLVNSVLLLKNNFKNGINKYKFKKDLLNLINITDNVIPLIEQEKFWFTKWTEFDFRMELQAKRSQEVY